MGSALSSAPTNEDAIVGGNRIRKQVIAKPPGVEMPSVLLPRSCDLGPRWLKIDVLDVFPVIINEMHKQDDLAITRAPLGRVATLPR